MLLQATTEHGVLHFEWTSWAGRFVDFAGRHISENDPSHEITLKQTEGSGGGTSTHQCAIALNIMEPLRNVGHTSAPGSLLIRLCFFRVNPLPCPALPRDVPGHGRTSRPCGGQGRQPAPLACPYPNVLPTSRRSDPAGYACAAPWRDSR